MISAPATGWPRPSMTRPESEFPFSSWTTMSLRICPSRTSTPVTVFSRKWLALTTRLISPEGKALDDEVAPAGRGVGWVPLELDLRVALPGDGHGGAGQGVPVGPEDLAADRAPELEDDGRDIDALARLDRERTARPLEVLRLLHADPDVLAGIDPVQDEAAVLVGDVAAMFCSTPDWAFRAVTRAPRTGSLLELTTTPEADAVG